MRFAQYQYLCKNMFVAGKDGRLKEHYTEIEAAQLPPLVLAYIGDAYFNLFVRTRLLYFEKNKVQVLNDFAAKIVSAVWQAYAYRQMEKELTQKEQDLFRRAYHAQSHAPRAASVHDYHTSTGIEAIIGYLQLTDEKERLQFICEKAFELIAKKISEAQTDRMC